MTARLVSIGSTLTLLSLIFGAGCLTPLDQTGEEKAPPSEQLPNNPPRINPAKSNPLMQNGTCLQDNRPSLHSGAGAIAWYQATNTDAWIRIDIKGITSMDDGASVIAEHRPSNGTQQERATQSEFIDQAMYIVLPDGPASFYDNGSVHHNPRSTTHAREPSDSLKYTFQSDRQLGFTVQSFGPDPHIEFITHNAKIVECVTYQGTALEINNTENIAGGVGLNQTNHDTQMDHRLYLATMCIIRSGGPATDSESLQLTMQQENGFPLSSRYSFSNLSAPSQPIPFGFCMHKQGVSEAIHGEMKHDGHGSANQLASYWMVSLGQPIEFESGP